MCSERSVGSWFTRLRIQAERPHFSHNTGLSLLPSFQTSATLVSVSEIHSSPSFLLMLLCYYVKATWINKGFTIKQLSGSLLGWPSELRISKTGVTRGKKRKGLRKDSGKVTRWYMSRGEGDFGHCDPEHSFLKCVLWTWDEIPLQVHTCRRHSEPETFQSLPQDQWFSDYTGKQRCL